MTVRECALVRCASPWGRAFPPVTVALHSGLGHRVRMRDVCPGKIAGKGDCNLADISHCARSTRTSPDPAPRQWF